MVKGLEHPCQGVDSQVEKGTTCEVQVHHATLVVEVLGLVADAIVCVAAVDGADFAASDDGADVDGEGKVTRPDLWASLVFSKRP